MQSIQKVPSGIKIGKEKLNSAAYVDDNVLMGKNEIEIIHFVEKENVAIKLGLQINEEKIKYLIMERKNSLK
jgi:hypothetical protein